MTIFQTSTSPEFLSASVGISYDTSNVSSRASNSLQHYCPQESDSTPAERVNRFHFAQDASIPPPQMPFQTHPRFHQRTRIFKGGMLEHVVALAILLTVLEIILGITSINFAVQIGINPTKY